MVGNEALARKMLEIANGFVGVNRKNNWKQITKFLNLFGLAFADPSGKPYPYCAAGVSYTGAKAYCLLAGIPFRNDDSSVDVFRKTLPALQHYFLPSTRCTPMLSAAKRAGRFRRRDVVAKPGWLVYFNFDDDAMPEHVGIVREWTSEVVKTVEFNTGAASNANGGAVARRLRGFETIIGYDAIY